MSKIRLGILGAGTIAQINSDILSESLEDTFKRVMPYYKENIEPLIFSKKNIKSSFPKLWRLIGSNLAFKNSLSFSGKCVFSLFAIWTYVLNEDSMIFALHRRWNRCLRLFALITSICGRYVQEMRALAALGEHKVSKQRGFRLHFGANSDCGGSTGPRPDLGFPLEEWGFHGFRIT